VAGIGNAYADEILWHAQIHPYRKRTSLTSEEIDRLHASMRTTLIESTEKVRQEMGEAVHLKPREFFAVHMRAGEACPRCGTSISSITANQHQLLPDVPAGGIDPGNGRRPDVVGAGLLPRAIARIGPCGWQDGPRASPVGDAT
jgi:hypothetical protein